MCRLITCHVAVMHSNIVNALDVFCYFTAATRACFETTKTQEVEVTLKEWLRNHNRYNKCLEYEDQEEDGNNGDEDEDAQRAATDSDE